MRRYTSKHYAKVMNALLFCSVLLVTMVGEKHALAFSTSNTSWLALNQSQETTAMVRQETRGSCYSLDVIFVVDQSGTMSDPNYPTDPTNQRQTAVQAMVDWLASNVLDACPESRHQIGVISFGDKSRIDLPLTLIAPDTMEELLALEKRLNEKIIADDMNGTQPISAFQKIPKMFSDGQISAGGIRKKVVVFLTDGLIGMDDHENSPEVGFVKPTQELADYINEELPFDEDLLKREQCISALLDVHSKFENVPYEKLNDCYSKYLVGESAYAESTYLHIVLMNYGDSWPEEVKKIYRGVADSHAGEVRDFYDTGEDNRHEIPTHFVKVLSNLTGVPTGQVQCGGVAVNPYLDKAVFMFYKFSPDTKVSLRYTDAQGEQHQVIGGEGDTVDGFQISDYQAFGTNERYIFENPYPGIWYVESDRCRNGGISAFYQSVNINPGGFTLALPPLPEYDIPPYHDESNPTYLTYQMRDDAGELIQDSDMDIFSVLVKAVVTPPQGDPVEYELPWNSDEQQYKATIPIDVPIAGSYLVSFKGTTLVHKGDLSVISENLSEVFDTEQILFEHKNLEFRVEDVIPFTFSVSPADKEILPQIHDTILGGWPLEVVPVPVRVEVHARGGGDIVGADGNAVSVNNIILDLENAFEARIVYPDGTTSVDVTLLPVPNKMGLFEGEIPFGDSLNPHTLEVDFISQTADGYGPDMRNARITFSRQDVSPLFREEFYYFLLGLLGMSILAMFARYIWMHTNPVRGYISIYNDNQKMDGLDIFTGRRITSLKYKGRGIDLATVHVRRELINDDDGAVEAVKVYGTTECKKTFSFSLRSGDSENYCSSEHINFSIRYDIKNPELG